MALSGSPAGSVSVVSERVRARTAQMTPPRASLSATKNVLWSVSAAPEPMYACATATAVGAAPLVWRSTRCDGTLSHAASRKPLKSTESWFI